MQKKWKWRMTSITQNKHWTNLKVMSIWWFSRNSLIIINTTTNHLKWCWKHYYSLCACTIVSSSVYMATVLFNLNLSKPLDLYNMSSTFIKINKVTSIAHHICYTIVAHHFIFKTIKLWKMSIRPDIHSPHPFKHSFSLKAKSVQTWWDLFIQTLWRIYTLCIIMSSLWHTHTEYSSVLPTPIILSYNPLTHINSFLFPTNPSFAFMPFSSPFSDPWISLELFKEQK